MKRRIRRCTALALALLCLWGCGSSPSAEVTPTPMATETPALLPDPTATPSQQPQPTESQAPPATPSPTPATEETPSPTPEETPADTAAPQPTATDTREPEPSATPGPSATATPVPTASQGPVSTPAPTAAPTPTPTPTAVPTPQPTQSIPQEITAITDTPAAPLDTGNEVGGQIKENEKAKIDYSYIEDGYVKVLWTASTDKRLKVKVSGPTTDYTYNIKPNDWVVFPLSDGNGDYKVSVYENTTGTKYAAVLTHSFSVKMKDEFGPFLWPNQYVNYSAAPKTVKKADQLCAGISDNLEMVTAVYNYVVGNITYDQELAASVSSGYLPDLDKVLAKGKGICFDYAALMAGMLRSQGVPCKLVVGYAGTVYHAWISVWSKETGWIDGVIYFDGSSWQRMDPTFASTGNSSEEILKYIGNGTNYTSKYFY